MAKRMDSSKKKRKGSGNGLLIAAVLLTILFLAGVMSLGALYYLEKNKEDAEAWMKTTEGALTNLQDVLTKIDAYYNQGVSEYSTVSDRETIITTLKQFKSQLYKDGDADNAGRTIFTGYRTDSTLTFQHADPTKQYEITQNLTLANVRQIN